MAIEYRFLLVAYTDEDNRGTLDAFILGLLTEGFYASVPVPNRNTNPSIDDLGPEHNTWGGYLYPNFRIMAPDGTVTSIDDPPMGTFAHKTPHAQAEAICAGYKSPDALPGFIPPKASDAVAVLMADSRWCPPSQWAQKVIDRYYDAGLRFYAVSFNLLDALEHRDPDVAVFYTVDDIVDIDFAHSTHCNALILCHPDSDEESAS